MHIRAATVSDHDAIIACADLAFNVRACRGVVPDGERMQQIRAGSIHMICEAGIREAGIREAGIREAGICEAGAALGFISFWRNSGHVYVDTVAVRPRLHRRGLGSRLLAFAEREAARLGLRSVRLFTDGNVAKNLAFYRQRGYRETDRCEDAGFSRVFYRKDV